ncbi:Lysidine-tRNA(Ile) synthetase [Syntrophomonas zehnderi OL-4]|uniref:tRNA(Ile)-lysidine synthase n=1 Tax=Syntrophomonas zehnderi OL-4 TaxID=690567 RepID=A0A0E3W2N2_9FIRM|nr:tRNA lysidine(34) synthetase TilS [Syntrophomonas zehnderi]CFX10697.1 Lysidine-tRNA(Ile) synthetase [Syntrophomonas zehnderi OL-4]
MLTVVKDYIIDNRLLEPGERVIVAVSGGPDSMALLNILKTLSTQLDIELVAAHVNHDLRPEAQAEAEFVAEQSHSLGIPCHIRKINVRELARQEKTSLEDAGRRARYRFFYTLLAEQGAAKIATAHHRDDVAETVLLHLLRGSGIQGLRGIMPQNGELIRPLLAVEKEELIYYLKKNNLNYCWDQSNEDPEFLRNRIRHQLIPLLEQEYNPRIVANLNRLADIAQAENEFLEDETSAYWNRVVEKAEPNTIIFSLPLFSQMPLAVRRRLVMRALAKLGSPGGWEARDVEKILELSEKPGSAKVIKLKKQLLVNKSYERIIFTKNWSKPQAFCLRIAIPGEVKLPGGSAYYFSVEAAGGSTPDKGDRQEEVIYLDYDKMPQPLVVRSRQEGDVFQPAGFSGHKRLKKYLIEKKVPFWERDLVPVLASQEGKIYAILGHCVSQAAAVSAATQTVLIIKKI